MFRRRYMVEVFDGCSNPRLFWTLSGAQRFRRRLIFSSVLYRFEPEEHDWAMVDFKNGAHA